MIKSADIHSKINVPAYERRAEMRAAILDALMTDRHETVLAPGLIIQWCSPPPSLFPIPRLWNDLRPGRYSEFKRHADIWIVTASTLISDSIINDAIGWMDRQGFIFKMFHLHHRITSIMPHSLAKTLAGPSRLLPRNNFPLPGKWRFPVSKFYRATTSVWISCRSCREIRYLKLREVAL